MLGRLIGRSLNSIVTDFIWFFVAPWTIVLFLYFLGVESAILGPVSIAAGVLSVLAIFGTIIYIDEKKLNGRGRPKS